MEATLTVMRNPSWVELVIPSPLFVPRPMHHKLIEQSIGYVYRGQVLVEVTGLLTSIRLRTGTGRGTTNVYDELIGAELRSLRLTLGRQLRRLAEENPSSASDELVQNVKVHVSNEDVERFQRAMDAFRTTHEARFDAEFAPFIPRGTYTEDEWVARWYASKTERIAEEARRQEAGAPLTTKQFQGVIADSYHEAWLLDPNEHTLTDYLKERDAYLEL